jgi:hypothetical protein
MEDDERTDDVAFEGGDDDDRDDGEADDGDDAEAEADGGDDQDSEDDDGEDAQASGGGGPEDLSDTTAPSIGPRTTFDRRPPEERLAGHEQSETDAMGLDKHRQVVGGQYGASAKKQMTLYGVALLILAVFVVGFFVLVGELDQPEATSKDEAPWSSPEAPQNPSAPLQ